MKFFGSFILFSLYFEAEKGQKGCGKKEEEKSWPRRKKYERMKTKKKIKNKNKTVSSDF